jgi:hypothetical protein
MHPGCVPVIRIWNLRFQMLNCTIWLKACKCLQWLSKIIFNAPSVKLLPERMWDVSMDWEPNQNEQRSEDNNVDNATCTHWMTTDISSLKTTIQSCSGFKSSAENCFIIFREQQQSCSYQEQVQTRNWRNFCCDFSENYFIIQNEVHGFHWHNAHTTLCPLLFTKLNYRTYQFVVI